MADTYHEWERACARIRDQNRLLLSQFGDWLAGKRISQKTVRRHLSNADLFANHFLLEEGATGAAQGMSSVSIFMGYWFIRKVSSCAGTMRSEARTLIRLATFMAEKGLVEREVLRDVRRTIKTGMPGWLGRARRYEDPSITDRAEVWR